MGTMKTINNYFVNVLCKRTRGKASSISIKHETGVKSHTEFNEICSIL